MDYDLLLASAIENYRIFYSRYTKAKIKQLNSLEIDETGKTYFADYNAEELEDAEFQLKKAREKIEEILILKDKQDDKN